jgi:hypothetical protein
MLNALGLLNQLVTLIVSILLHHCFLLLLLLSLPPHRSLRRMEVEVRVRRMEINRNVS